MGRILVADDEPDMRALLADLLEEAGHQVDQAENGQVAVQQAQSNPPDLVLLDVLMPMMDGLQALRRIRDNPATENLPVILLTAFALSEDENSVLETPYTYHLTKPWRRGIGETAVNSALALTN